MGISATSADGNASWTPSAMAVAAWVAERLPLKEFGATTIFILVRLGSVNGDSPVLVLRRLAAHRLEVDVLKLQRELAHLAVPNRAAVDLDHRRDLRAGSTEQQLLARVQLGAIDAPLYDRHVELFFDHADHEGSRDPFEDVFGSGGRPVPSV